MSGIALMIMIWVVGGRIAWVIVPKLLECVERETEKSNTVEKREIVWEHGEPKGMPCGFYTMPKKRK